MGKILRENIFASYVLAIIRVYLGWQWMTAGWGKVTGDFSAAGFLKGKVANPVMSKSGEIVYPNYTAFLENVALPNAELFSFMVAWGEFLVGLGLIVGLLTTTAAFFGITMNFAFMFAGVVSTNPWLVLLTIFILVSGANAGKVGLDRIASPYLKERIFKQKNKDSSTNL